ncbi:NAD-dependent epimerase/dehydratase family protein [Magnetospirillum sp. UT-4]|uniref:NAD-dependent epimerase/dehydratase family protein n=1 Tax=Magnetospirillum sp. UT-4 TaxID=2681467 RepID=UPI00137EFD6D|nr:NAD-dependent epimerase/dehydratase family protein [Magnetospirillum sp. UT-4]CAA7621661.1 UDP-glucose 4-epimerase [Magnetospirillum sp. UT-4]
MRVLVTGATGFVGPAICRALAARGHQVVAAARRPVPDLETRLVGDLGPDTQWSAALEGCEAVVHLAARAHVMDESEADPLAVFRRINCDGTLRLAEQAEAAGVRRFLFMSSIKVNGEATAPGRPFRADDPPAPVDPYGIAKAEAEAGLAALGGSMAVVILRPPLVHGPGAKGNLAALMRVLARGWPLPLGAVDNRRSLVGLDNLADAAGFLLDSDATGPVLVRDGEDVSTSQLMRLLAAGLGVRPRLLPVPPALLRLGGAGLGRGAAVARLLGSLTVDDAPLRALGWQPPLSLAAGLARMTAVFRERS